MAGGIQAAIVLWRRCSRRSSAMAEARRCGGCRAVSRRMSHFWASSEEVTPPEAESADVNARKLSVMDERKITQAAPDWLPLVPGSSYWIPSEDTRIAVELSEDKLTAFFSPSGWPAQQPEEEEEIYIVTDSGLDAEE